MSLNYLGLYILMVLGLFLGSLYLPWTPHYPVKAKMTLQPMLVTIRAPIDGVIEKISCRENKVINFSQEFMVIKSMDGLLHQTFQKQKTIYLKAKLSQIQHEILYHKQSLARISVLFKKKVMAKDEYHQRQEKYQQLLNEKNELLHTMNDLNHQRFQVLQSPISGTVLHISIRSGDAVQKNQKLLVIKPHHIQYYAKLKLPIGYQNRIFLGQKLRLSTLSSTPLKIYPIIAEVIKIYPYIASNQIMILAKLQKQSYDETILIHQLPLEGYLMGKTMPMWRWILNMLRDINE